MIFSIITCSYNCLEGLQAACAQVRAQKDVSVEHLIIDGGSTDGTRVWLEDAENEHRTFNMDFKYVSEPDRGLYDALNKGLHMATGDVVGVLHCDDVWEHDRVLARVAEAFRREASLECGSASCRLGVEEAELRGETSAVDAVYGDLYYVDADDLSRIRRVWRSGGYDPRKFFYGWMPPHTALFVRREAALRVGDYRTDHGSAGDYEWMLRAALTHRLHMVHLPGILVRMRAGGASNLSLQRRLEANRHDRLAWKTNHLQPFPLTLVLKPLRKVPQWFLAFFLIPPAPEPAEGSPQRSPIPSLQRLLDIFFSALALLLLSPLLIPLAVILRFTGEGEIFFRQQRIGKGGTPFGLIKFVTMLKNSPNMGTGTVTLLHDPRVLPVGRFLRRTKLNELPQFINVLKGDMGMIGPRPQTRRCFDSYPKESQERILTVRPGLSGIGAIVFRNEEELMDQAEDPERFYDEVIMPYKGKLEEWYVAHQSLPLYLKLIFLTGWVVLFPNSRLHTKWLKGLPEAPEALRGGGG